MPITLRNMCLRAFSLDRRKRIIYPALTDAVVPAFSILKKRGQIDHERIA